MFSPQKEILKACYYPKGAARSGSCVRLSGENGRRKQTKYHNLTILHLYDKIKGLGNVACFCNFFKKLSQKHLTIYMTCDIITLKIRGETIPKNGTQKTV